MSASDQLSNLLNNNPELKVLLQSIITTNESLIKQNKSLIKQNEKIEEQLKKLTKQIEFLEGKLNKNKRKERTAFKRKDIEYVMDLTDANADAFANQEEYMEKYNIEYIPAYPSTLYSIRKEVEEYLQNNLLRMTKLQFKKKNEAIKIGTDDLVSYYTSTKINHQIYNLDEAMDEFDRFAIEEVITKHEVTGSGFIFYGISEFIIVMAGHELVKGGTYKELPEHIKNKKCCINIKNNDNFCFAWSIIAALHPAKDHTDRISSYKQYINSININGFNFPFKVTSQNIEKFEKQNNLAICVFGLDKEIFPMYITKRKDCRLINLLLYEEHFILIKNLNGLLRKPNDRHTQFYCNYCLIPFYSNKKLEEHNCDCDKIQKVTFPAVNTLLKFANNKNKIDQPFVIYADFECIIDKENNEHIPCSYGVKLVCRADQEFTKPTKIYRGEDAITNFLKTISDYRNEIINIIKNVNKPIVMNKYDNENYKNSKVCYLCEREFNNDKVRDHCHLSGKYRGAMHNKCNLHINNSSFNNRFFIPVIFHNLKNYDAHLIMQEIGKFSDEISCIPSTEEKYISFSMFKNNQLRFIDSYAFLASSLDKLSKSLDDYPYLKSEIEDCNLLKQKGIYPYEYFDSFDKFDEPQLPEIDKFYSSLYKSSISQEDYNFAKEIWNHYNLKSLGAYHDIYLKTDVLLLTDIFESFRTTMKKSHGLDPAKYFTLPGFSFDAMLKLTKVELELLSDPDMYLMIEKGIRGGISQAFHGYAKANNKYCLDFDKTKPTNYLAYLDANNLYGHSMSQLLPVSNFEWCTYDDFIYDFAKQYEKFEQGIESKEDYGYILEIDAEIPENMHDHFSNLPPMPEKIKINETMLSQFNKQFNNKIFTEKLIPTLYNKTKYVIHYKALMFYISLGIACSKIHRIIRFKQNYFLKKYITLNTELRKRATTEFEKNLYKLLNNSVFGKTMENVRNRSNLELVSNEQKRDKLVKRASYQGTIIYNESLVGIKFSKINLKLDKPIYLGFSILDLSKIHMYDFHYNFMKKEIPDIKLLYMDTDSFVYNIPNVDYYDFLKEHKDKFDLSNFDNELKDETNKKVIGKFKDELGSDLMTEFVALKSKMYSYKTLSTQESKAKGINRTSLKELKFNEFKNVQDTNNELTVSITNIESKKHNIFTTTTNKKALSCYNDKIYMLDAVNRLPYGHKSITN